MRIRTHAGGKLDTEFPGFSMLELLVSIAIIVVLMAVVFAFIGSIQNQYTTHQLLAEVSQGGRSAFDVMTQEINQAGYNPPFSNNKTVAGGPYTANGLVQSVTLNDSSNSPATAAIFYGTRLVIGNTCTGTPTLCNQEEVLVNEDTSYLSSGGSILTMGTTTVPVVLTNNHNAGEPVYTRNYPYPQGIIYDNRTTVTTAPAFTPAPPAVADNKLLIFGAINDKVATAGSLAYGEYRIGCFSQSPSGVVTMLDACTPGCTTGPFTLTRFVTRLQNTNKVFAIPPYGPATAGATFYDSAVVSPITDNIQGTCANACPAIGAMPGTFSTTGWLIGALPDETSATGATNTYAAVTYSPLYTGAQSTGTYIVPLMNPDCATPVLWFKMSTFGSYDTTNTTYPYPFPYFQNFVTDVEITLTVQRTIPTGQGPQTRTQRLQTHIVPRNILDSLKIATNGGSLYLPTMPIDVSQCGAGSSSACTSATACVTLPLGTCR